MRDAERYVPKIDGTKPQTIIIFVVEHFQERGRYSDTLDSGENNHWFEEPQVANSETPCSHHFSQSIPICAKRTESPDSTRLPAHYVTMFLTAYFLYPARGSREDTASTIFRFCSIVGCTYSWSVVFTFLCPKSSLSDFASNPFSMDRVAKVCRSVW